MRQVKQQTEKGEISTQQNTFLHEKQSSIENKLKDHELRLNYDKEFQTKQIGAIPYKIVELFNSVLKYILDKADIAVSDFRDRYGNDNLAYFLVFISGFFYVAVSFYLKILWSYAMIVRGFVTFSLMYLIGNIKKYNMIVYDSKDFKILTLRNVLSAFSQLLFFYCINKLSVSLLLIISNTGPIFVFILNYFLFGVKLTLRDVIGIGVSFIGVIMVSGPQYFQSLFTDQIPVAQENEQYLQGVEKYILIAISILTWFGWAFAIISVRYFKSINTFEICMSLSFCFIIFGSFGIIQSDKSFDLSLQDILGLIFTVGFVSFLYQITFISSTTITKNHGPITLINYTMIVESFLVEVIFFQELPNIFEILGSILVLLGLASYFFSKLQKK